MSIAPVGEPAGDAATFLGHPRGLAFLAFTKAWERFSFYGMQSLLVLYMVQSLFLPGQLDNVAGMAAYRSALEAVLGQLSAQALAGQTFGLYAGLVYFTPLIGGWVADRWLGAKKTVVVGVLLMTAGHAAMVFDQSFLLALLLLILGSGALKGNVAAQVGQLYAVQDARRTTAFAVFSLSINIGAIFGPLVCGLLAQVYGWHYGFGAAGLLMLVALGVYLLGLRHFPEEPPVRRDSSQDAALITQEWRSIAAIMAMLAMMVVMGLGYDQMFNMGMFWIDQSVDLDTPLTTMVTRRMSAGQTVENAVALTDHLQASPALSSLFHEPPVSAESVVQTRCAGWQLCPKSRHFWLPTGCETWSNRPGEEGACPD